MMCMVGWLVTTSAKFDSRKCPLILIMQSLKSLASATLVSAWGLWRVATQGQGLCKHRGNRIQDKLATLCAGHVQPVSMLRLLESFDS